MRLTNDGRPFPTVKGRTCTNPSDSSICDSRRWQLNQALCNRLRTMRPIYQSREKSRLLSNEPSPVRLVSKALTRAKENQMQASQTLPLSSSTSSWPGRILSGIASLFLLMDAGMHIANPGFVVDASHKLGWAPGLAPALGIIQLACLALYLFPRTAILGAVLMTGD